MRDLDGTDRKILRLLLADARRPYADVAEHVDLSPPAVSDRVERLRELGVIKGFTLQLDRSRLREGLDVLVELTVPPTAVPATRSGLRSLEGVEHLFHTADGALVFTATMPDEDVAGALEAAIDLDVVRDIEVRPVADAEWHPHVGDAALGLECAECGNSVTSEGVVVTLDGDRYEFCCPSCRERFEDRYETLKADAGS